MHYVFYDLADGQITMSGMVSDSVAGTLTAPAGMGILLADVDVDPDAVRVDLTSLDLVSYSPAGQIRKRALVSQDGFRWDPMDELWLDERPIERARSDLLRHLKRERERRIESGFAWDGSFFDSDAAISQPRLLGLFTSATAGGIPQDGYPWRLADNSWRVLSAVDASAVWGAFQSHLAAHFAAFAAHESAILAETDLAALQAYDTTAGWPT